MDNPGKSPPDPSLIDKLPAALRTDLRIGWVIGHGRSTASSRLQGYLVHEWLLSKGYDSRLIAENFNQEKTVWNASFFRTALRLCRSRCDVVVFEGGDWPMMQLARLGRRWGKRAVGVRCDPIPGPYDDSYDLTIVPTADLQEALHVRRGVVIEDAVEVDPDRFKRDYTGGPRLRVGWVGHPSYGDYISALVARLRARPEIGEHVDFELISKGAFATRQWSEATVVDDILSCDVALIAIPQGPWFQGKSANRLALMMSLGMPTVATMIPSYAPLAHQGENGLFVTSDDEIAAMLVRMRDAALREKLGRNARRTVAGKFDFDAVGPKWLAALQSAMRAAPASVPRNPGWHFISVLVRLASTLTTRP